MSKYLVYQKIIDKYLPESFRVESKNTFKNI